MKKIKSAFSIIELSVVLAIVAIIISGAITVSSSALKNAKIKVTKERMAIIQKALETHVYTYKRLPCPASLALTPSSTSYGAENISSGACVNTSSSLGSGSGDTTASTLRYGAVPAKALGLNTELMSDGFGNKFSYIVPADNSTKSVTNMTLPTAPTIGFEGSFFGATIITKTNNVININETISAVNPGTVINGRVAYVLISHGPNGLGAVNTYSTTQNSVSGAVSDEVDNYWASNYDNEFFISSRDSGFDDIVVYDDRENIIRKIGGFYNTVCTQESSYYPGLCNLAPLGTVTFPASYNGATAVTGTACSTINASCTTSGGAPTRTCGPNGQWNTPTDPCNN